MYKDTYRITPAVSAASLAPPIKEVTVTRESSLWLLQREPCACVSLVVVQRELAFCCAQLA